LDSFYSIFNIQGLLSLVGSSRIKRIMHITARDIVTDSTSPTGPFTKQPSEKFEVEFDFLQVLTDLGELIVNYDITAITKDVDSTNDIIDSSRQSTTSVFCTIKDGIDGYRYKITVVVYTNNGNIYEHEVMMKVEDI